MSFVERENLTMRMSMRRLTRLTKAFSKKVENLEAAVALHFMFCNFGRVHQTLRVPGQGSGRSRLRLDAGRDCLASWTSLGVESL
jgi:hypothetical protein